MQQHSLPKKPPPLTSTSQVNSFQEKKESTERDHTPTPITILEILNSNASLTETENGITMLTTTPGLAHSRPILESCPRIYSHGEY